MSADATDADDALLEAWNLGMDDEGWSDAVMDAAARLVPILVEAGYAAIDEALDAWHFTDAGVARAGEIDADRRAPS